MPKDGSVAWTYQLYTADTKAKCRHLKKLTCKKNIAAGVYLSEAPSPPIFLFRGGLAIS
jgi:hypothetical protein